MHEHDFLCATHQWNPEELNIGFYAALANNGTINYFRDSLDIIERNPLAHDQKIMHAVARDNNLTLHNETMTNHFRCKFCGHRNIYIILCHQCYKSNSCGAYRSSCCCVIYVSSLHRGNSSFASTS